MKIASSQVQLSGLRAYQSSHTVQERLQVQWGGKARVAIEADKIELSQQAQAEVKRLATGAAEIGLSATDKLNHDAAMLEILLSALLGKKIKIMRLEELMPKQAPVTAMPEANKASSNPGFALNYDYHEVWQEHEHVNLAFQGSVVTADGDEINFSLNLDMRRSYYEEHSLSIRVGQQMVDPLVINFDADMASLSDQRFAFDLTADGIEEKVPLLGRGSGFLVLDRNQDGKINDGSELFGAQSGNGFKDLAAYDSDGNGWIDENDPIFKQLMVWVKGEGQDKLISLEDLGIGALYLGSVSAQFSLQGGDGQILGQQQRAGLFLREDKTVGTMQHVDLVV